MSCRPFREPVNGSIADGLIADAPETVMLEIFRLKLRSFSSGSPRPGIEIVPKSVVRGEMGASNLSRMREGSSTRGA